MNIDEKSEIISNCPECGAPLIDGMNCWEQLGGIIAWEYDDPELLAEHFKTVACYNLQHPAKFLEEAIIGLKASFIEHLDKDLTPAEIRKLMGKAFKGNKRVLRDKKEINPVLHNWKMTIADVYIPDCPKGAADRVRKWAAAIRLDL